MVARSQWDGAVTVYRYGCPAKVDFDDTAMAQLRLAHNLRNELVAIEHRYQDAVSAAWNLYPQIAEADRDVSAAEDAVATLREQAAEERKQDRTTVPRAETKAQLSAARATLREARAARREAKERYYPAAKSVLLVVRDSRNAARKALYADYVQGQGLFWATYNDVVQTHETAVSRVADLRKQGRPAQLRFHRWRGEGTLTVQLQREAGKPPRSPQMLASGEGPWRNVCHLRPWVDPAEWAELSRAQRKDIGAAPPRGQGQIDVSLGRGRRLSLPIVVHRMLPPEADVTLVRVTRRRLAGHHRLSVSVTARIPAPPTATGALIAMHIGWRSMDGDLRVAVVTADRALMPPREGLPVRRVGHGWEVRLPASLRHVYERTETLRSRRDRALDVLRADLAAWLDEHPQEDLTDVRRWRSPARFATLAMAWRDAPPEHGVEIAQQLEAWRRQDRHLWEWEANERDQIVGRVRDLWGQVAAWLAGQAGLIVADDTNIGTVSRVPAVGNEDSAQARLARAQRQIAAPGALRAAVKRAAQSRGVTFEALSAKGITSTHCGCDTKLVGDPAQQVTLWCETCQHGVDQDINAAEHLLATASAPVEGDAPESARSSAV